MYFCVELVYFNESSGGVCISPSKEGGVVFHGSTPQADPQPRTQTTNAHHETGTPRIWQNQAGGIDHNRSTKRQHLQVHALTQDEKNDRGDGRMRDSQWTCAVRARRVIIRAFTRPSGSLCRFVAVSCRQVRVRLGTVFEDSVAVGGGWVWRADKERHQQTPKRAIVSRTGNRENDGIFVSSRTGSLSITQIRNYR